MLARVPVSHMATAARTTHRQPDGIRVGTVLAAVSVVLVLLLAFAAAGLMETERIDDAPVAPRSVASQFAA
jgi:hypothetical protein